MSFVIRLGPATRPGARPPAFAVRGCRWEHRCGWCTDEVFMTAAELVAHVKKERERGTHQPR